MTEEAWSEAPPLEDANGVALADDTPAEGSEIKPVREATLDEIIAEWKHADDGATTEQVIAALNKKNLLANPRTVGQCRRSVVKPAEQATPAPPKNKGGRPPKAKAAPAPEGQAAAKPGHDLQGMYLAYDPDLMFTFADLDAVDDFILAIGAKKAAALVCRALARTRPEGNAIP
jgi:hypothetical protein